jgi:hypothetical protein
MKSRLLAPGLAILILVAGSVSALALYATYSSGAREASSTNSLSSTQSGTTSATLTTAISTTIVSSVTSSEAPLAYVSSISQEGLQLRVTLNSSSIRSHGGLTAQIEVLNTLNRNISFSALSQNQKISEWNGDDNICGENPSYSLAGFAVFQGHFSADNISAAGSPLQLAPPFYPPCAFTLPASAVTFLPNGKQAIATYGSGQPQSSSFPVKAELNATTRYCTGSGIGGHGGEISCGASPGLVGYWSHSIAAGGNMNFTSPAFTYFPAGQYTIVATDDWNQYVYAYFVVF